MLPINKEVHAGVDATIACVITGITKQLDSLVWRKDGTDVKTLSPLNYLVSPGSYDSNSQTTTLTVKDVVNTEDSIYTCVITSNEWLVTDKKSYVDLNVYGNELLQLLTKYIYVYLIDLTNYLNIQVL